MIGPTGIRISVQAYNVVRTIIFEQLFTIVLVALISSLQNRLSSRRLEAGKYVKLDGVVKSGIWILFGAKAILSILQLVLESRVSVATAYGGETVAVADLTDYPKKFMTVSTDVQIGTFIIPILVANSKCNINTVTNQTGVGMATITGKYFLPRLSANVLESEKFDGRAITSEMVVCTDKEVTESVELVMASQDEEGKWFEFTEAAIPRASKINLLETGEKGTHFIGEGEMTACLRFRKEVISPICHSGKSFCYGEKAKGGLRKSQELPLEDILLLDGEFAALTCVIKGEDVILITWNNDTDEDPKEEDEDDTIVIESSNMLLRNLEGVPMDHLIAIVPGAVRRGALQGHWREVQTVNLVSLETFMGGGRWIFYGEEEEAREIVRNVTVASSDGIAELVLSVYMVFVAGFTAIYLLVAKSKLKDMSLLERAIASLRSEIEGRGCNIVHRGESLRVVDLLETYHVTIEGKAVKMVDDKPVMGRKVEI